MSAYPSHSQPETAPSAVLSLVLGIVGLMIGITAPLAWKYGRDAEAAVDASGGTLGGRGLATAGKILGIIGTVILALCILMLIALMAFAGA